MGKKLLGILFFLGIVSIGYSQEETITESTDLEFLSTEDKPVIHPNPTYGKLELNLSKYPSVSTFEVVIKNIIGKKIWSEEIYDKFKTLDLSFLNKGSYLMSIKGKGETLNSFRLVIITP
jgi:hypothetical protein